MTAPQGQDEYTPTTDVIRDAWVDSRWDQYGERPASEFFDEFDRWLAAHDAEVAARVWDEATDYDVARQVVIACETGDEQPANPYRQEATR